MKTPKVGDVMYSGQWKCNRLGQLEFLTSTQTYVTKDIDDLPLELFWMVGEEDDELSHDSIIIWEMRRIK